MSDFSTKFFKRFVCRIESIVIPLFIIGLPAGGVYGEYRAYQSVAPSRSDLSFEEFHLEMPPPHRLRRLKMEDTSILVWWGELKGPIAAPSGRSLYIFDENGTLIHWTSETGDGSEAERWLSQCHGTYEEITVSEALDFLREWEGE